MSSLPRPDEPNTEASVLRVGGIELNVAAHAVSVYGQPINLSPQEFRLLATLLQNVDHVLPSKYLLDELWGPEFVGDPGTLHVHILRIRTKLDRQPGASAHIRTVRGIGYVFDSTPQPSDQ
jgi:two-component system, OmpR family, response regulator RegX3